MGSNAIRMLVAEFDGADRFRVLEAERATVRLGHDVFLTGKLTAPAMDAAIEALKVFARRMDQQGVSLRRAVATSAVREASNGAAFALRVKKETGFDLEIISGAEEARLIHRAICHTVNLGTERWVAVDLGGGSVEVSLVDREDILWSESQPMGSVRLLEELSGAGDEPGRFHRLLSEYIATLRLPQTLLQPRPAGFIATGGNIESLVRFGDGRQEAGVDVLETATLRSTITRLTQMSYAARVSELGLREDRADVILPAALVYEKLATICGAERILVPGVGMREGLVLDLMDRQRHPKDVARHVAEQVELAALAMGRRFQFDESHARHVHTLAQGLFDHLAKRLDLAAQDRHILTVASLLHDVGTFISPRRHHKHSHYLIAQGDFPGLDQREIQLAALVARYHRKSEPAPRHPEFAAQAPGDQHRVQALAALLRVADASDREHLQNVDRIHARLQGRRLTLSLEGRGDLLLERWALARKGQLLARTLSADLAIRGPLEVP